MKDNISKKQNLKKQAKKAMNYEKFQLKNNANILVIFLACVAVLFVLAWILSVFGLAISYYLFKSGKYFWGATIILIDLFILRSFLKTKI